MTTLISLIGEQPIPNLLPIRYLKPDKSVLVYSDRTAETTNRLIELIEPITEVISVRVNPYDPISIQSAIEQVLQSEGEEELIINLTGGTKPMSLAAFLVAFQRHASLIYVQSEQKQSWLYRYVMTNDKTFGPPVKERMPSLINNHDYIYSHVGSLQDSDHSNSDVLGKYLEKLVADTLTPYVDEITPSVRPIGDLDIDLVARCDNQVAILEIKSGKNTRKGLNQLNTAGGREYFGTYTEKILVSNLDDWEHERSNQKELAKVRDIIVIEAPSIRQVNDFFTVEERTKLITTVCRALGRDLDPSSLEIKS